MHLMIVTGEWPNKNSSHVKNGQNGLVDTICYLLSDYKKQNKQILAGLLYVF